MEPTRREKRETTRLYKAISAVFSGRFDLSETQKQELIKLCYQAAKLELDAKNDEFRTATISRVKKVI